MRTYTLNDIQATLDRLREDYWVSKQLNEHYDIVDLNYDDFVCTFLIQLDGEAMAREKLLAELAQAGKKVKQL